MPQGLKPQAPGRREKRRTSPHNDSSSERFEHTVLPFGGQCLRLPRHSPSGAFLWLSVLFLRVFLGVSMKRLLSASFDASVARGAAAPEPLSQNFGSEDESQYLSMRQVCERTALSPSYVYHLIDRNLFPPFVKLGPRARGLPEDDLDRFLATCLALRNQMRSLCHPVVLSPWPPTGVIDVPCCGIRLMRLEDILARLPVGRSHLYRLMVAQDSRFRFPWPAPLGERARRWAVHEVEEWLRRRRDNRARDLAASLGWVCQRPGSNPDSRCPPQE